MTIQETAQIMDILTVAYPQFYAGRNAPDPQKALALWASMFADDDVQAVAAAVKALIAAEPGSFPPTIGAVKVRLRQLTAAPCLTESEAWGLVAKAIRNSAYESREEFDRLPEDVQAVVGSPEQLKAWSQMDSGSVHSVVASNFQRSYKAIAKRREDEQALPGDVKRMLAGVADRMALHD